MAFSLTNQVILDEDYDENYEPTEQGKEHVGLFMRSRFYCILDIQH